LSSAKYLELSLNSRTKILQNYKEEVVAQKYNDLYKSLK